MKVEGVAASYWTLVLVVERVGQGKDVRATVEVSSFYGFADLLGVEVEVATLTRQVSAL